MMQELRLAVRRLLQGKVWSALVVLSLALGIGANTALFSATNGLLLRKVPVRDPDSLVRLRHLGRNHMANNVSEYGGLGLAPGEPGGSTFSHPLYLQLKQANQTLVDLIAGAPVASINVVVDGHAEIATAYLATGNYQPVLGVQTVRGRTLAPGDDRAEAPPAATISARYWARRFGNDPAAVGKVVQVNNTLVTIVGVTAPEFTGVQRTLADPPDLVLPLVLDRVLTPPGAMFPGGALQSRLDQPSYWWLQLFGPLRAGVTAAQVEGNLGGVFQQAARDGMASHLNSLPEQERSAARNRDRVEVSRLSVSAAARGLYDHPPATVRGVAIISGVVGLILLLVCANVANLLLSRAAARQKEMAVRLSLGASRRRLVGQLLLESVLLAVTGGATGLAVAYWGRQLLPDIAGQAPLDWRVLLFTASVSIATGVLFGIAPAMRVTGDAGETLKDTSRSIIGSRTLLTKSLLVIQVAISVVLLIGAGLFLRTVNNLREVDVGFNPHNLVVFRVNPQLNRYDAARIASLYEQITSRLAAAPGVRLVTLTNPSLLSGGVNTTGFLVHGRPAVSPSTFDDPKAREAIMISRMRVAPSFFETMEIPLVRGRSFTDRDNTPPPRVAVINEAAARKFFPGEDPLGQRFGHSPETTNQIEIIGLVRDAKYSTLREPAPPTMYVPYAQDGVGAMNVVVRTTSDPAAAMPGVREAMRQVDANVPIMDMMTQTDQIERRFAQERVFARAYSLFGGLALLVAAIGLFGLMSYSVTRRTTEIGIRLALGARHDTVLRMVLLEALVPVGIGVIVGTAAALGAGRLVATLLFGLEPSDLTTMVAAVGGMFAVAFVAGYLPARRAARLDPMLALKHE